MIKPMNLSPKTYTSSISVLSFCSGNKLSQTGKVLPFVLSTSCCHLITIAQLQLNTRAGRNRVMLPEQVLDTEKQFVKSSCKIRLQITKFWARHDFAARSCCSIGLQGSNHKVARDTLSQYGDHSCEIGGEGPFMVPEPDLKTDSSSTANPDHL